MSKEQLQQHYLDTIYSVYIDDNKYDVKIGDSNPEVVNQLLEGEKQKTAVMLTAYNPRSQDFPLYENKSRNNYLRTSLVKNNYVFLNAVGQGNDPRWPAEEGFFILGLTKDITEKLAVEYGQYAYVWFEKDQTVSLGYTSVWQE